MALLIGSWWLDVLIFTILAIVGVYKYATRKFGYWKKLGVVEFPPTPVAGNFSDHLLLKKSPGQIFKDLYDKSSNVPYMGFYMFDKPSLLLRDPELIKSFLVSDWNYFKDRYASASLDSSLFRANIFTAKNPAWKYMRTKLSAILTPSKLKKMFDLMLEVGEDLDARLKSLDLTGEGRILDIKNLCGMFTSDVIATTIYGLKVNSLNNPDNEFRKYGCEAFKFDIWRGMKFSALYFVPGMAKSMDFSLLSKNNAKFLHDVVRDTIMAREKSGIKRNDLIDLFIELKGTQADEQDQKIFEFNSNKMIDALASVFFISGFETSSILLSFTMYELALAPHVQTKLRAEIKDALKVNGGKITYDMVTTLPYLDMVMSETLRMYPPVPFLDRVTIADYKISNTNLIVKKGVPVYVPMLGLHFDPEYFPNPKVFDPERFTEENKTRRIPYTYIPFGNGPRVCIASRLGLLQTKLGIVRILSDYELTACKETMIPMKLNPKALLTEPYGGLFLNVRKITTETE